MSRVNQILLALALALGALLLVLEKPWAVDPYAAAEARRGAPIFRGFEPSKAVKIEIAQAGNAVVLQKGASGWTIPSLSGFRANEDAVARLLDRVRTMTRGDLVTQDPSTFVKYHVQEADAPRVKVFDETGKAAVDFYQGRPFFDPEELQNGQGRISSLDCYVRAAGSNDVYRVGDFQPLDVRANDWIPRNLYRFEVPAVQTLTLAGADIPEEIVLNHAPDGEWSLATPAGSTPANRDACDALARSLASLYLEEVLGALDPKDSAKYGFDNPRIRVSAVLSGGGREDLVIGLDAPREGETAETAYATGGFARSHVAKVFKSSVEALRVTKAQILTGKGLDDGTASGPASQPSPPSTLPQSGPATKPK